jgi:hypothetical protein
MKYWPSGPNEACSPEKSYLYIPKESFITPRTSCTFIARSTAALSNRSICDLRREPLSGAARESGHFQVLIKADISCVNDKIKNLY